MTVNASQAVLPIIRTWSSQEGVLAVVPFTLSLQTKTMTDAHGRSPVLLLLTDAARRSGMVEDRVLLVASALRAFDREPTSDFLSETLTSRVDGLLDLIAEITVPA